MVTKDKSGAEVDHLFPRANFKDITVKRNADVENTVRFIPWLVERTEWQAREFAKYIKRDTDYETCKALWHFTKSHIAYHKDDDGVEQVRDFARTWADRGVYTQGRKGNGVDCDCYSVFLATVLACCGIRKIIFRITKYVEDKFTHIYPVVPTRNGEIIMDCVVSRFNYEEPYSIKKDTIMNLEYLNGIESSDAPDPGSNGDDGLGWGWKSFSINNIAHSVSHAAKQVSFNNISQATQHIAKQVSINNATQAVQHIAKQISLKNALNLLNRLNPATFLIRNGFLASMKLNIFNVAKSLRWGYLSPAAAIAKGADPGKHSLFQGLKSKVEDIYFAMGGEKDHLQSAILGGKGNADGQVMAGLSGLENDSYMDYDVNTPLSMLLGELYQSTDNELNGLGEPITLAAIAASTGVVATVAKLIKNIGGLFPGKSDDDTANAGAGTGTDPAAAGAAAASIPAADPGASATAQQIADATAAGSAALTTAPPGANLPAIVSQQAIMAQPTIPAVPIMPAAPATNDPPNFWATNKTWLTPAIGVAGLAGIYLLYKSMQHKGNATNGPPLSGVPRKKKNPGKGSKKMKFIPLM